MSYRDKVKQGALKEFYLELLEERMTESVAEEERRTAARGEYAKVKNEDDA